MFKTVRILLKITKIDMRSLLIAQRPDEIKTSKTKQIFPFNSTFPIGSPVGYNPTMKPKILIQKNPNGKYTQLLFKKNLIKCMERIDNY